VTHIDNPSYSGGRDQQDHGLKPAQANSLQDPISKTPITHAKKKAGGMAQGVDPEFKPQYHKRKENSRAVRSSKHRSHKPGNMGP
jgi:hypothetical protein